MGRASRLFVATMTMGAWIILATPNGVAASHTTPRWVKHVQNYPGGLSGWVRSQLDPHVIATQRNYRHAPFVEGSTPTRLPAQNLQMNSDTDPPVPQNETSVDYSRADPMVAVAASNDYVSGGVDVMRTSDGGQHWRDVRVNPQFLGTRDFCTGGDPSVVYSRRDHAFYLSQLCFFRNEFFSEVHLFKSVDGGKTWTPGRFASIAATNFDYATGTVDESLFFDKEYLAIDNARHSPHFGRIYLTYIKFHFQLSGFSDYCPVQLAYTDHVPTQNPQLAAWQHTAVVSDQPGGTGQGLHANQWAYPEVEKDGDLDVTYALEDCNTGFDRHLEFTQSQDGGASFTGPVQIDHPGEFVDNPNLDDTLPPKFARIPLSPSFDVNKKTGVLAYVYQNNVNRDVSGADISIQYSTDEGKHWTHAKFLTVGSGGNPARGDQFFPWTDSDPNGRTHVIWFDNRRDSGNLLINTFQDDFSGRPSIFSNHRISTKSWNPNVAFFSSGSFIGDYNGLASSNRVIYPVWTDGRNNAIARTGIGETDIFTNLEIR
jgi:hypothetical protein